jgi:hypothetical protein
MATDYTSLVKTFSEEIRELVDSKMKESNTNVEKKVTDVYSQLQNMDKENSEIAKSAEQNISTPNITVEQKKNEKQLQENNFIINQIFTLPKIKNELEQISIRIKEKQETIIKSSSCLKYAREIKTGLKLITTWTMGLGRILTNFSFKMVAKVINASLVITKNVLSTIKIYGTKITNILLSIPIQVISASIKTLGFILNYSIITPLKWFWSVGTAALSYVWKGIKTIFGVGWTVIKSAVDILGSGVMVFGRWMTKLFINTLTNPLSLLIMVPALLMLMEPILNGLTKFISTSLNIFVKSINEIHKPVILIKKYIWSGVEYVLDWVNKNIVNTNLFDFSGLLETLGAFTKNTLNDIFGKENIEKTKNIIIGTYNWIKTNGSSAIDVTKNILQSIFDFSKTVGEKGVKRYLIDVIESSPLLKNTDIGDWIRKQLIARLNESLRPEEISKKIDVYIKETETSLSRQLIAQQYTLIDTTKFSREQIRESMREKFKSVFMNLTEKELNENILIGISMGKDIKKGKLDPINIVALNLYQDRLKQLQVAKFTIDSGAIDVNTEAFKDIELEIKNNQDRFKEQLTTLRTSQIKNMNKNKVLTQYSLNKYLNNLKDSIERSKQIIDFTPQMEHDTKTVFMDILIKSANETARLFDPSGYYTGAGLRDRKEWDAALQFDPSDNIYETQSIPKLEMGGVVNPADNFVSKLNDESSKFIKENLKNIDIDLDALKKRRENKKIKQNIINITPNKIQSETCELYTMKQLSKSLLTL